MMGGRGIEGHHALRTLTLSRRAQASAASRRSLEEEISADRLFTGNVCRGSCTSRAVMVMMARGGAPRPGSIPGRACAFLAACGTFRRTFSLSLPNLETHCLRSLIVDFSAGLAFL